MSGSSYSDAAGAALARAHPDLVEIEPGTDLWGRPISFPLSPHSETGTTTRSESSEHSEDEQHRRDVRRTKLMREHNSSRVLQQFETRAEEEAERIRRVESPGTTAKYVNAAIYLRCARETVEEAWMEQGIYDQSWPPKPNPRLRLHEQPLDSDLESGTDKEEEGLPRDIGVGLFGPLPGRPAKSESEERSIEERRIIRECYREPSRPFFQFVYQISRERERLLDESTDREITATKKHSIKGFKAEQG